MSWLHRVLGRDGTSQLEVDANYFAAAVRVKPIVYGALGHYRVNHRCALVAAQAANSRLFEVRNPGPNLIVPTRLVIKWFQTAAHTAAIEDSLDVFKATSFSAVDTTNTVTPVASVKRASMAAAPGAALIRGVTIAGVAAGMTGGSLVKDGGAIGQTPLWLTLAFADPAQRIAVLTDNFDDVNGTHPFVLATNEGIEIENRVLLGAAAGSSVYIDFSWAEVTSY
jgi:hypothetical protein